LPAVFGLQTNHGQPGVNEHSWQASGVKPITRISALRQKSTIFLESQLHEWRREKSPRPNEAQA
jgi:hypothetical protein